MLPTKPGLYRCADGDLWVIAPGSTNMRKLTEDGIRVTDDDAEFTIPMLAAPFTRVRMVHADD